MNGSSDAGDARAARARLRPPRGAGRGLRVGLLGGSFNPAHAGHRHISLLAIRHLGLAQVWWLVSPQNPLKPEKGMAPLDRRLDRARRVAADPRIRVTDIEQDLDTSYTIDTIRALKARFPQIRFVWLMGADNLVQIPEWERWPEIFQAVPVAVFARPSYSFRALAGRAARRFRRWRLRPAAGWRLAFRRPPAWVFFHDRPSPVSATRIRARHPSWTDGERARESE